MFNLFVSKTAYRLLFKFLANHKLHLGGNGIYMKSTAGLNFGSFTDIKDGRRRRADNLHVALEPQVADH